MYIQYPPPSFLHVCVRIYVGKYGVGWGCTYRCCVCVCLCVETQSWCQLSSLVALYWDSLSRSWCLAVPASLASPFALGIPCLCLSSAGITDGHHICVPFTWGLGIWTPVFLLACEVLYPQSYLRSYTDMSICEIFAWEHYRPCVQIHEAWDRTWFLEATELQLG